MPTAKQRTIKWLPEAEDHDYTAAKSYLSLLHGKNRVREIVAELRGAGIAQFMAKDIFRASRLSLLGPSNFHVEKERIKIRKGAGLSPLLLVRDTQNGRTVIADGYHRLCAVYGFDEDAVISCKIV
jgi:hypothetical protein